jgi:hypothetical protein
LTADFSFAISVFFFVLVGCFVDLDLAFTFEDYQKENMIINREKFREERGFYDEN